MSGHGVGAALLSFTLNHMLSPSAEDRSSPRTPTRGRESFALARAARLNRQFPMDRTRQYFTFVYGVFDALLGGFQYAWRVTGASLAVQDATASTSPWRRLPIGMIEDATFDDQTVILQPGDRVYFYSDGVIEALDASEQEFGYTRLMAEIDRQRDHPLRVGLDLIANGVRDWSGGRLQDDVSLLAIERVD